MAYGAFCFGPAYLTLFAHTLFWLWTKLLSVMERFYFFMERFPFGHVTSVHSTASIRNPTAAFLPPAGSTAVLPFQYSSPFAQDSGPPASGQQSSRCSTGTLLLVCRLLIP